MHTAFLIILSGVPYTILITVVAFLLGAIGGIPLVVVRRLNIPVLPYLASLVIDWLRAVPPIVWIFLVFYGAGSGLIPLNPITAATIALGLLSSGYMAEIYRGGLLAIPTDQREASAALGLGALDSFRYVISPQALRMSIPAMTTYLISLLKESSLAATIGVAEITFHARAEAELTFEGLKIYGYAGLFYVILTVPVAWFSRSADRRLRAQAAR